MSGRREAPASFDVAHSGRRARAGQLSDGTGARPCRRGELVPATLLARPGRYAYDHHRAFVSEYVRGKPISSCLAGDEIAASIDGKLPLAARCWGRWT